MMGIWITVAIVLFIVGSVMALKPSARDVRLDRLRMTARKVSLEPKLVACPNWILGKNQEFGKGMIAQYGVILDNISLAPCDYQIIDNQWRPCEKQFPANFALDKHPIDLPDSIRHNAKGLSFKANFVCLYWDENIGLGQGFPLETTENDLIQLKSQLQNYAMLVQNSQSH